MARLISCMHCGKVHKSDYMCSAKRKSINRREYKEKRKDTSVYKNKRWNKAREYIIGEYYGICLWAYYVEGRIVKADCVHHIIELLEDESKCYDEDNLITLSNDNHIMIHNFYYNNKNSKKYIQKLLIDMKNDWKSNKKELGSFKEIVNRTALGL